MESVSKNTDITIKYIINKISTGPRFIILLALIAIIISIPLILMFSGFDKVLFKSSLTGYVRGESNQKIENAAISIQDKTVRTDSNGLFKLDDLTYGQYDIVIKANGYEDFSESITIKRGENTYEFNLERLEFGEIQFQLSVEGSPALLKDDLVLSINDQVLKSKGNSVYSTGKVIAGKYLFSLTSPNYKDIEESLVLEPGFYEKEVKLIESADLEAKVIDWVQGNSINPDEVKINTGGNFEPLSSAQINNSSIILEDLDLMPTIQIQIKKDGYVDLNRKITIKQGFNGPINLKLVPEGKIPLVKYQNGSYAIQATDLNGKNPSTLLNQTEPCNDIQAGIEFAVVKCVSKYYLISYADFSNPRIIDTYEVGGQQTYFDLASNRLFVVDNNGKEKLYSENTGERIVYYAENEAVTSVESSLTSRVFFTTTNGVWSNNFSGTDLIQETTGNFKIGAISFNSKKILLINTLANGTSNIWLYDRDAGVKSKLTVNTGTYSSLEFINDSEISYIDAGVFYQQKIGSSVRKSYTENVLNYSKILGQDILYFIKTDGVYLRSITSGLFSKVNYY